MLFDCTLMEKKNQNNNNKIFLGIDKTPISLERSFKAATKLKGELPTDIEMESIPPMELLYLVEDIYVKT